MTRGNVQFSENPFERIMRKKVDTHIERLKVVLREGKNRSVISESCFHGCLTHLEKVLGEINGEMGASA